MVYFQIHSASKKLIFKKTTNACICIFNKKLFLLEDGFMIKNNPIFLMLGIQMCMYVSQGVLY